MSEPFPVWITAWCLSQGIEEATAYLYPTNEFWCVIAEGRLRGMVMQAGQWHRTKEAAVKEANKVLARAIASRRRSLEELENVCFTEDDNEGTGNVGVLFPATDSAKG